MGLLVRPTAILIGIQEPLNLEYLVRSLGVLIIEPG
jgi:hypothetical protein